MNAVEAHRAFFAALVTSDAGPHRREGRLEAAFRSTPRERFCGPGPWRVLTAGGYIETPSDLPTLLYQDVVVALEREGSINNGQPSLHALCLASLKIRGGETVVHIGAGSGYYSAILAELTGAEGNVFAYEVKEELARRATLNLAERANVEVRCRSGSEGLLPASDIIYVSAGATAPLALWLDALRPGGRLLFPLTPESGFGAMLAITRQERGSYAARFLCGAAFIPCLGARDDATGRELGTAFQRGDHFDVQSLRRGTWPDATCWFAGEGWWLSKEL